MPEPEFTLETLHAELMSTGRFIQLSHATLFSEYCICHGKWGEGGGALGLRQRGPARRRAARPCLERLSAASSSPKSSKASAVAEGKEGSVESRSVL